MAIVGIDILGPLRVRFSNCEAAPTGAKLRSLFAILAFRAGHTVMRDELIDELDLMNTTDDAVNALHAHLARLRRWLRHYGRESDLIETVGSDYRLNLDRGTVDAHRFVNLTERALELAPGTPSVVASILKDALCLWRGDAMLDALDGRLGAAAANELDNWRAVARETLIDAWLCLGSNQQVVLNARKFIAENPLNEMMHARHIRALCRMGRYAEAIEAYKNAEKVLSDELGVGPGSELRLATEDLATLGPGLALPAESRRGAADHGEPTPHAGRATRKAPRPTGPARPDRPADRWAALGAGR
ncbi:MULTISPECIES: AfsR/SARP family transcriptional regulator [unclassified Microbispora]|uniref:AfsR/SARP family transcriptional regulator n=1 Tax=unclassified Microbispora TaxID=2614687 RepID=UPI001473E3A9|nr:MULTISPECIES: AfsR/SARP family transcriptional regulator [unclassified Microbispora]